MIKIAFYGKSGAGKSTATKIACKYFEKKGMEVENIKLALPLYEIQQHFYQIAGNEVDFYQQDQGLLENIATSLRKLNYGCLTDIFDKRLEKSAADVVVNDDVRDIKNDYPYLKRKGFIFIKLNCCEMVRVERLKNRNDLNIIINSKTTDEIDLIDPDYSIDTSEMSHNDLEEVLIKYLNLLCD